MKLFKTPVLVVFSSMAFIALCLVSCEDEKISGDVVTDPQLLSELYAKSTDTLAFESGHYILEVELYRDFFPGVPLPMTKRSPLIALTFLVNTDRLAVNENLSLVKAFVIKSDDIWIASLRDGVNTYIPDYKRYKINTNGPEWDTGIYVDVVLEIKNQLTLERYFIIARNQYIQRTE
jgi:hypothetical protein